MTNKAKAAVVRKEITEARKRWGWSPSDIIALLRGGGNSSKGSSYEREICKQLSRWWSGGKRDDIFWRSSGSGARAKVRGRGGKDTAGQHGDIAATDPIGAPFTNLFTVEMKRGYSETTVQDLLDRQYDAGMQEWERFFSQTIESHKQAGSWAWLLITRRDRRDAMVWFPRYIITQLARFRGCWATDKMPPMYAAISTQLRDTSGECHKLRVAGTLLRYWLNTDPKVIAILEEEWRSGELQR